MTQSKDSFQLATGTAIETYDPNREMQSLKFIKNILLAVFVLGSDIFYATCRYNLGREKLKYYRVWIEGILLIIFSLGTLYIYLTNSIPNEVWGSRTSYLVTAILIFLFSIYILMRGIFLFVLSQDSNENVYYSGDNLIEFFAETPKKTSQSAKAAQVYDWICYGVLYAAFYNLIGGLLLIFFGISVIFRPFADALVTNRDIKINPVNNSNTNIKSEDESGVY